MTPTMPIGPSPSTTPPPWYAYSPPASYNLERSTQIDRTKTGLLLLIIGALLVPVPYITYIGSILVLIGAILVILGRKAFGPSHSRNAIWSIIVYVVGIAIIAIGAIAFLLELGIARIETRNGTITSPQLSQALTSSFQTLLVAAAVGGAVIGIAQVLFTYAIQNRNGRIILWAGYASSLAIGISEAVIIGQSVSDAVAQSIGAGTYDPTPLQNLQNQLSAIGLLGLIPAALYAGALYLVWTRIGRGELPPTTPPVSPIPTPPSMTPPPPPT
jgi:MFS family permease